MRKDDLSKTMEVNGLPTQPISGKWDFFLTQSEHWGILYKYRRAKTAPSMKYTSYYVYTLHTTRLVA